MDQRQREKEREKNGFNWKLNKLETSIFCRFAVSFCSKYARISLLSHSSYTYRIYIHTYIYTWAFIMYAQFFFSGFFHSHSIFVIIPNAKWRIFFRSSNSIYFLIFSTFDGSLRGIESVDVRGIISEAVSFAVVTHSVVYNELTKISKRNYTFLQAFLMCGIYKL